MKTNKYADLIKFGLKQKTLMSLNESEIDLLHKKLCKPKQETKESTKKTSITTTYDLSNELDRKEMEDKLGSSGVPTSVDDATKKITMADGEMKEGKKKLNPWAICTSQLSDEFGTRERSKWSSDQTAKYERCVRDVKKSVKEGKDYFDVLIENKILSLVEKHIKPKMKKSELVDLIGVTPMNKPIGKMMSMGPKGGETREQKVAPAKPTTKPGTKERPGKPTPFTPYKPKAAPGPKAKGKSIPEWLKFDELGIKLKK